MHAYTGGAERRARDGVGHNGTRILSGLMAEKRCTSNRCVTMRWHSEGMQITFIQVYMHSD